MLVLVLTLVFSFVLTLVLVFVLVFVLVLLVVVSFVVSKLSQNSVPAVHVPVCCAYKFVAPSPIRKMPTKSSLFFCPLIMLKI